MVQIAPGVSALALTLKCILLALMVLLGGQASSPPPIRTVTARSGASFLDSVGVNVHMAYEGTPYIDVRAVAVAIRSLHVHWIRDVITPQSAQWFAGQRALMSAGIRADLVIGSPTGPQATADLEALKGLPAVGALEGPNEYDGHMPKSIQPRGLRGVPGRPAPDQAWAAPLRTWASEIGPAVRGDPHLRSVPIVAPALEYPESYVALGPLGPPLAYGNVHDYPWANPPEEVLAGKLTLARAVAPGRPVIASEAGYQNAAAVNYVIQPVGEFAAAVYLPRLLLDNFASGVERTFIYELLDEAPDSGRDHPESEFGLLNPDFSPKPAYLAIQRLLGLISPAKPAADRLALSVDAPPGVDRVLLSDGRGFLLALWSAAPVWDPQQRAPLPLSSRPVRIKFACPHAVVLYSPNESSIPQLLGVTDDVTLSVSQEVRVVALSACH